MNRDQIKGHKSQIHGGRYGVSTWPVVTLADRVRSSDRVAQVFDRNSQSSQRFCGFSGVKGSTQNERELLRWKLTRWVDSLQIFCPYLQRVYFENIKKIQNVNTCDLVIRPFSHSRFKLTNYTSYQDYILVKHTRS